MNFRKVDEWQPVYEGWIITSWCEPWIDEQGNRQFSNLVNGWLSFRPCFHRINGKQELQTNPRRMEREGTTLTDHQISNPPTILPARATTFRKRYFLRHHRKLDAGKDIVGIVLRFDFVIISCPILYLMLAYSYCSDLKDTMWKTPHSISDRLQDAPTGWTPCLIDVG